MSIDNKEKSNLLGNEYDFDQRLIDSVRNMSPSRIVNFIKQIYSHASNYLGYDGIGSLQPLFYSCCSILNYYNEDVEFANSLKNTLNVFDCDSNKMMDIIKKLKPNNLSSFVLLPTASQSHMFVALLYKRNDDEYELITVNKSNRDFERRGHIYEGYIVTHNEILYFIKEFVHDDEHSMEYIYAFLDNKGEKVQDGESILHNIGINSFSELKSRCQKTGNCFYKNPEAGFRFAWFAAHFENKNKNQLLDNVSVTPKGPTDTAEMHNQIVDKLCEAVANVYADNKDKKDIILKRIDYEKHIYNVNKKFRQYCKEQAQEQSLEIDKIKQGILDSYGCENLKDVLVMMDITSMEKCIALFETYNLEQLDDLKRDNLEKTVDFIKRFMKSGMSIYEKRELVDDTFSKFRVFIEEFDSHIPYALSECIKEFEVCIMEYICRGMSAGKDNLKQLEDKLEGLLKLFPVEEEIGNKFKNKLDAYNNKVEENYQAALKNYEEAYLKDPDIETLDEYVECLFDNQNPIEALEIVNKFLQHPLYESDFNTVGNMINYNISCYGYSLDAIKDYADSEDDAFKYYIRACYYERLRDSRLLDENLSQAFKLNPKFIKAYFEASFEESNSNYDKVLEIVLNLIKEEPDNIEFKTQYIYCIAYIFEQQLIDSVRNMSTNRIVNFIQQIYSHASNYLKDGGIGSLQLLFYSCCSILNYYNEDVEFANSLKNTLNVFDCDSNKMMDIIKKLKPNNLSSFVLLPTVSRDHMFATLLYKKKDNEYELITVNKGNRNFKRVNYRTCEGYIVTHDEILYFIKNFVHNKEHSTEYIYAFLNNKGEKVQDGESILQNIGINSFSELKSRDQKTGNCFYKNPEAGFRFAWFAAHFENKSKNQLLDNVSVTPKGPIDTAKMHNQIVDKLREAVANVYADNKDKKDIILTRIDYEKRIYNVNKKIRQYCKEDAQSLEIDEIKKGILEICKCENFKECFGMMDTESIEMFIKLFENRTYDLDFDNLKLSDLEETVIFIKNMNINMYNKDTNKYFIHVDYLIFRCCRLVEKFNPIPYVLSECIRELETEIINYVFMKSSELDGFKERNLNHLLEKEDLKRLFELIPPEGENKNKLDAYNNKVANNYQAALENYKEAYLEDPEKETLDGYVKCLFDNQKPIEALKLVNKFLKKPLYEGDFNYIIRFIINYNISCYDYSLDAIKEYAHSKNDAFKYYIRVCYYDKLGDSRLLDENLLQAFKLNPKFIKVYFDMSYKYDKVLEIVSNLIENEPNNIEFKTQYIYCIAYIIENEYTDLSGIKNSFNFDKLIKLIEECYKILKYDKYNKKASLVKKYCIKKIDIDIDNFIGEFNDEFEQIYKFYDYEINSDNIKNIIRRYLLILKKISEYSKSERDEKIKEVVFMLIKIALAKFYLTKFLKSLGNEYEYDILTHLTNREIVEICNDMVKKGNDSERKEIIDEKYKYIKRVKEIAKLANVNYEYAKIIIEMAKKSLDKFRKISNNKICITSDDIKNIIEKDQQILEKISEYSKTERDEKIKGELFELIEEALAKFYLTKFLKSSGNGYEFDMLKYLTPREIVEICNDMVKKETDSEREKIISEKYEYIKRVKEIEELAKVNYECAEIIIEMANKSLDKFRETSNNKDEITSDDIKNIIEKDQQILEKISEYSKSERDEKMEGELFELIEEALAKFYLTKFLKSSGNEYEYDMLKYLTPREIVEICNDMVQKDDDCDKKYIQNKVAELVKNRMVQDIKEYNIIDNEEKIKELLSDDDIVKEVFNYLVNIMNSKDENDKSNNIKIIKAILSGKMKIREKRDHYLKQDNIDIDFVNLHLKEYKVDIDVVESKGYTPLTYAIEKGYTHIAKMLIQKGYYVDKKDNRGNRPITLALKKFKFKIVYLLIKRKVKCELNKILSRLKLNKTLKNKSYNIQTSKKSYPKTVEIPSEVNKSDMKSKNMNN